MTISPSHSRIDWVSNSCSLLLETAGDFARTRPFEGLTIGTAIHLEPKTAALLMALKAGGARLVATGNLNSTSSRPWPIFAFTTWRSSGNSDG